MKNSDKKGLKDKDVILNGLVNHEAFNKTYFANKIFGEGKKVKFYNKIKGERQQFSLGEMQKLKNEFLELSKHIEIEIKKSEMIIEFQTKLNDSLANGNVSLEDMEAISNQLNF